MFSDRFQIFPKQIMNTRVDCVALARADKSFHRLKSESSPIHFEENGTN